jgi:hypothetical protein
MVVVAIDCPGGVQESVRFRVVRRPVPVVDVETDGEPLNVFVETFCPRFRRLPISQSIYRFVTFRRLWVPTLIVVPDWSRC